MTSRILSGLSLLAVPALLLSACGGGDSDEASAAEPTSSAAPEPPAALWVGDWQQDTVSKIDPATGEVTGSVDVYAPNDISIGSDLVWSEGYRIDPDTLEATDVDADSYPDAEAAEDGGAWFAYNASASPTGTAAVVEYDDATGEFGDPIELGMKKDFSTVQLVAADGILYGLSWDDQVYRVDTATGEVTATKASDNYIYQLSVTDDAIWAPSGDSVLELSLDDLSTVAQFAEPGSAWPNALDVAADGSIWVADDESDLRQLDPEAGTYGDPIALPDAKLGPTDLEVVDGTAWVLCGNQLFGIDPATGEATTTVEVGSKKDSNFRLVSR